MAVNNPAGDFYNPPSNLSQDFEEFRFEDCIKWINSQ